jgi:hypothetical protein
MKTEEGDIKENAEAIDEWIFHYVDEKVLVSGSEEDIIREIELDDAPREDW